MRKHDLAGRLAKHTGLSKAAAADRLGDLVHEILTRLRNGEPARLPGLGTFLPGDQPAFRFDPEVRDPRRKK